MGLLSEVHQLAKKVRRLELRRFDVAAPAHRGAAIAWDGTSTRILYEEPAGYFSAEVLGITGRFWTPDEGFYMINAVGYGAEISQPAPNMPGAEGNSIVIRAAGEVRGEGVSPLVVAHLLNGDLVTCNVGLTAAVTFAIIELATDL